MSDDPFQNAMEVLLSLELEKAKSLKKQPGVLDLDLLNDPLYLRAQADPVSLSEEEELELLAKCRKSKENGNRK